MLLYSSFFFLGDRLNSNHIKTVIVHLRVRSIPSDERERGRAGIESNAFLAAQRELIKKEREREKRVCGSKREWHTGKGKRQISTFLLFSPPFFIIMLDAAYLFFFLLTRVLYSQLYCSQPQINTSSKKERVLI